MSFCHFLLLKEIVKGLAHGRVGVDLVAQEAVRQLGLHGQGNLVDQLMGFQAIQAGPQDLSACRVNQGLEEAPAVLGYLGLWNSGNWQLEELIADPGFLGGFFIKANS